jgi:beta-galactosidase
MASSCKYMDYWMWAREVDVVSNDHYLLAADPENHIDLAFAADLTRSLAAGAPWLLMEHSTSAVNWQPRNVAKRPGELRRNSLAHVARGSDSVLFFQWRASRKGAEKFHSAMLPHGGTATRIWREVSELGAELPRIAALRGTTVTAPVALLWDWQAWWALEFEWRPSVELAYRRTLASWYAQLWRDHLTVDFAHPQADLRRYPLVVAPSLYLLTDSAAANLTRYVREGGTLLVGPFSGVVDETDSVHAGGPPGPLRDVLGISVEEALPLRAGERVHLSDGTAAASWTEAVMPREAAVLLSYVDGPAAGGPALTRHRYGAGSAWYLSTRPDALTPVLGPVYAAAGITPPDLPDGVEVVRRSGGGRDYLIVINHTDKPVEVAANGTELFTGTRCEGVCEIPGGEVRAIRS